MAAKKAESKSLGERIRIMREELKIDLETLAGKTGISAEELARIENGTLSPPVGALIQISRALVGSSQLLSDDKRQERLKSYKKRTESYSYKNLTPDAEDKHLWAYLVTMDPKKEHEAVEYKHEGEEFVYVLEGKVEIKVGEEVTVVKKDASFHFNSSLPHRLKNLTAKQAKLLVVVYTP
ncbi:MAG: XRE family transcriptional regulator [Pseudomonadota bacterium]